MLHALRSTLLRLRRPLAAVLATLLLCLGGVATRAAEVELNTASRAELEQLRGIGIPMAERMLSERDHRPFADWTDAMKRVPGLKARLAARLSEAGLRVQGRALER